MSSIVDFIFIFIAGVSFLGFLMNAFFNKLKITNIIPLILIGILLGPVLNLINTGPQSTFAQISPFAIVIAIAVVLFDVGLNINFKELSGIFVKTIAFIFVVQIITATILTLVAYYIFGWSLLISLIFAFALSGTGTIAIVSLMRNIKLPAKLKTALLFESVATDILSLIVPLILIIFIITPNVTISFVEYFIFTAIVGSVLLGTSAALAWLYLLKKLGVYSRGYLWILTLTLLLAVYGFAQEVNIEGALSAFFFGLVFSNIGLLEKKENSWLANLLYRNFYIPKAVGHIKDFQKEIVFFIVIFFFVYIGLLFNLGILSYYMLAIALLFSLMFPAIRYVFAPLLRNYMSTERKMKGNQRALVALSYPRGVSPAIIAAVLITTLGQGISNVSDLLLLTILLTNLISGIGIFFKYKPEPVDKKSKGKSVRWPRNA